jgi:hypothetical protein
MLEQLLHTVVPHLEINVGAGDSGRQTLRQIDQLGSLGLLLRP